MQALACILIGTFAADAVLTVAMIGKPRPVITPVMAAVSVLISIVLIAALIMVVW